MKQLLWFNIPWYSLTYAVHLVVSLSLTCVHRLECDGEMRLSPVSPPTLARCVTLGRAVIRERGHSTGAALLQRGDSFPPSLHHSHCPLSPLTVSTLILGKYYFVIHWSAPHLLLPDSAPAGYDWLMPSNIFTRRKVQL